MKDPQTTDEYADVRANFQALKASLNAATQHFLEGVRAINQAATAPVTIRPPATPEPLWVGDHFTDEHLIMLEKHGWVFGHVNIANPGTSTFDRADDDRTLTIKTDLGVIESITVTVGDNPDNTIEYNYFRANEDLRPPATAPTAEEMQYFDGHHTMAELYEQRALYHALYVNLANSTEDLMGSFEATKSWNHHDGQPCFGSTDEGERWFIVTMHMPDGKQVSQHYPEDLWAAFHIPQAEIAPVWDGHTAEEGNARMRNFLGLWEAEATDA